MAYDRNFAPLVATCSYNGDIEWSKFGRSDLFAIDDDGEVPGGWLFWRDLGVQSPFRRVFAVVRGNFLFLFDNPNEDPFYMIPINECEIVLPERQAKLFDDRRVFKVNEGFEFDIKHKVQIAFDISFMLWLMLWDIFYMCFSILFCC